MSNNLLEMSKEKKYIFPKNIVPKSFGGYLLLIAPESGNWIVLENQDQIIIAKELQRGDTVQDIIAKFPTIHKIDILAVLKELEGKHFCEKMEPQDSRFTLRIYLTNKCNLRCKHCFMYATDTLENELTYDEIIELLNKSKKGGCEKVIFTGGEVLLKDRFIDILQHAHNLDLYVQVLTNGILWTEDLIEIASNYIDEIQISIDGFNEEVNSLVRGKNTYQQAIHTIENFIKRKKVFVSVIITPLYELLEKYKDAYIKFALDLIKKFGNEKFLVIFGKGLLDGREIISNKEKNKWMAKCVEEIYEEIYPNSSLNTFIVNHKNNRIYMNCGYGGLTVNSNGNFYFCGRIYEVKCYGNIRNEEFNEILKKRKLARKKSGVDNIVPCNKCDIKYICGGGCRVENIPAITQMDLEDKITFRKQCSEAYKNSLYKLMIESNEFLYW